MKIADLPFAEGNPVEVLRLDRHDPDFTGTGYCRLARVVLESRRAGPPFVVEDALVLALHSTEDQPDVGDDIELEFDEEGVSVLLSKFLSVWLPKVRAGATEIVLALCNPRAVTVRAPAAAAGATMHVGTGDVVSWLDDGHEVRLVADEWRTGREA